MPFFLKYFLSIFLTCASLFGKTYSYIELLDHCEDEQIEALQEAKAALDFDTDIQFQPLEGGLTRAKLYTFEHDGKNYVLRLFALGANQPIEKRQNEITASKIAHKLDIAPAYLFSDSDSILMIMSFVEGLPLISPDSNQLKRLGKMLKSLHSYSGDYPNNPTFKNRLQRHFQKGTKAGIAYPTGFEQEIRAVTRKSSPRFLVPSHGDLHPSNILANENAIRIIDWTTATWDDPYNDLSYYSVLTHLSPNQEKTLLKAYFEKPQITQEYEILQQEKAKVYLLAAAIWFRFSETEEEIQMPLEPRVAALDQELYSPTLRLADDYLEKQEVVHLKTAPKPAIRSYALSFYKAYLDSRIAKK